jgi:transcriptional regulator with XRE-family HTH domain
MSIREISRRTGLSRNTVRKYLTSGVVEPKYPARSVANKLDAFASKLEGWLKSEAKKGRNSGATPANSSMIWWYWGLRARMTESLPLLVIGVKTNTKPPRQLGAEHFCL